MGYFRESRNVELSTIYFLETNIALDWTGITVSKSFTDSYKAALPVVCVRMTDTYNSRREVGATTLVNDYIITIDVFARSDGQRLDLVDYIVDKLKDSWVYYEHSQTPGNVEVLTRSATANLFVNSFNSNHSLDFGEDADVYDRHRHFIQISVRKSE